MSIRAACLCLAAACCALSAAAARPAPPSDPYLDHNGRVPAAWSGPLFTLSHDYPSGLPTPPMPWRSAIGNRPLDTANAAAYAAALKESVARDMVALLTGEGWDAGRRGWYNDPWLGAQREPLHGMLVGHERVDSGLFPKSGLRKPFTTYVITYYDRTGAQTIGRIWARNPYAPHLARETTQYAEGSVTVKLAFTTAGPDDWPAMRGAFSWPIAMTANATTGHFDRPTVAPGYLMQVDIAVKDTQASPQTGWVFATFVHDKDRRPGAHGAWDRMVALGAQWGNDPGVNSAVRPGAALRETWINPAAPLYATETLGWGGRLSGPNDHGVNDLSVAGEGGRRLLRNAANSSCLSCHGSSQWNAANPARGMSSFMLPLAAPEPGAAPNAGAPYLNSPAPGSRDWLRWFQNRAGDVPMDPGSIAGDYDLALTFRVLPAWHAATAGKGAE